MKSFTRIKKIKGKEYLYEITPYYDPETKTIRHKSKYLGKNIQGRAVKIRQKLPLRAYSYGEYFVLIKLIEELGIKEILSELLSPQQADALVAIALNRAVNPVAMMNIATWYEGVYFYSSDTAVHLNSQRLSRMIEKIGSSSIPEQFFRSFINRTGTKSTLLYDITSLSSYSKLIEALEWGYNRDNDNLPQVNLSLVVDRQKGIPIFYEIYPGSIVDVSTLMTTIKRLKNYGIKDSVMVLDRGFFSTTNIKLLYESGMDYIIPIPLSLKEARKTLSLINKKLKDSNNMKLIGNEQIFVVDVKITIGEVTLKGYCYYNPRRKAEEQERFLRRLYEIKLSIERLKTTNTRQIKTIIEDIAGGYQQYLKAWAEGENIKVRFRNKAIRQRINRMGKFIILCSREMDWQEVLQNYRELRT